MNAHVVDNPQRNRYELFLNGEFAGWTDYQRTDDGVSLLHVEVLDELRGRGIGDEFMRLMLADLTARGEAAHPVCSFAVAYMRRH